jgi:hypothetical protein
MFDFGTPGIAGAADHHTCRPNWHTSAGRAYHLDGICPGLDLSVVRVRIGVMKSGGLMGRFAGTRRDGRWSGQRGEVDVQKLISGGKGKFVSTAGQ